MKRLAIFLLAAGMFPALQLQAQSSGSTTFFLDNYVYSYRFNPAEQNNGGTKGFFGFGIDNIYLGAHSNLGVSNVIFQQDGKLVTGLHESVPADKALSGLKPLNKVNFNFNENLLTVGFRSKESLISFEVNLRSDEYTSVPKDLFSLLKNGTDDESYFINDMHFNSSNYLEAAFGYSRKIENLTVGGRLKALLGYYEIGINLDKAGAVSRGGQMDVTGKGDVYMAQNILEMDDDLELGDFNSLKPAGFGMALELGATYDLDKFHLSLGLLDLGAVSWKRNAVGKIDYNGTIQGDSEGDLEEYVDIHKIDNPSGTLCALSPVVNAGARYQVSKIFSAGATVTSRFSKFNPFFEARLGATLSPAKFFSLAATAGYGNFGPCIGAAMSLNFPIVNFFIATDGIFTRVTPQYVPVKPLNTSLNLGLAIAF